MKNEYGKAGLSSVVEKAPIVTVSEGKIRGLTRNGNAVFRGIPYGDRCDGPYRFREPRPAKSWDGIRDCTKIAPVTIQNIVTLDMVPESAKPIIKESFDFFTGGILFPKEEEEISENCLVLNVVSPGLDEKKRPVMVYIHGGGYMSGSGNVMAECSDRLLDEEDIVMVTVNHRLNLFGGLYLGCFDKKYESSGLNSQLDLMLALKWIKKNIQVFGGDPQNVTLYGESGGGIKIEHLMAMPEENVDTFIQVFRKNCGDTKPPWQIFTQMVSMSHFLGRGAYQFAVEKERQSGAPVWLYSVGYDTAQPLLRGLRCAWHTAELPLSCRAVYYTEQEELSRLIAHSFAAFARTGSPSDEKLEWPAFTAEKKETMIFDQESRIIHRSTYYKFFCISVNAFTKAGSAAPCFAAAIPVSKDWY